MHHQGTVLLTGFGPFPGVTANASGLLVTRLAAAARSRLPGHSIVAETLPTEWQAAPRRLLALLNATKPNLVLHFGVSKAADGFVIETQAVNAQGATIDACGLLPPSTCVLNNTPARLPVTFPAAEIAHRLSAIGLPARLSTDAGSYLCNAILFHSLNACARAPSARVGFVHIPAQLAGEGPDGTRPARGCPLTWDRAVAGGLEILTASLGLWGSAYAAKGMRV